MTDAWETIETFDDAISAEAFAGSLRAEGVPAEVLIQSHIPGLINDVKVRVPTSLAHRARFLLNSLKPSSAELTFAATGELGVDEENET